MQLLILNNVVKVITGYCFQVYSDCCYNDFLSKTHAGEYFDLKNLVDCLERIWSII